MDRSVLESSISADKYAIALASLVVVVGLIGEYKKDIVRVFGLYWDAYPLNISVVRSVIIESRVSLLFPALVVFGVGAEWLYEADSSIREGQYTVLLDADNVKLADTAKAATERAADAETKVANLVKENIGLEKALLPRSFLSEFAKNPQTRAHAEAMKPFAGMKVYLYVVPDLEAQQLFKEILLVLNGYGMMTSPSLPYEEPFLGVEEGIVVYVTESSRAIEAGKTIARILDDNLLGDNDRPANFSALKSTGVRVSVGQFPANTPQDAIRIDIRSKPITGALLKLREGEPKKPRE
jgi:hypothetical protein